MIACGMPRALSTPDQTIVILSRTYHQAAILINRANVFTRRLNIRLRLVMGFDYSLQLPNGSSVIEGKADTCHNWSGQWCPIPILRTNGKMGNR